MNESALESSLFAVSDRPRVTAREIQKAELATIAVLLCQEAPPNGWIAQY
jgi:hypothetical protein